MNVCIILAKIVQDILCKNRFLDSSWNPGPDHYDFETNTSVASCMGDSQAWDQEKITLMNDVNNVPLISTDRLL